MLQDDVKKLREQGIISRHTDPVTLHPYLLQVTMQRLKLDQKWAYGPLSRLSSLALAMGYLVQLSSCQTAGA